MLIERCTTPGLAIYSYVIVDEQSKKAAILDPVRDVTDYIKVAGDATITDILETHVHADFVSGSRELKAALDGKATIHCSGLGGKEWTPSYADAIVQQGDRIQLGEEVMLEALHTPGHTPEHIGWLLYDLQHDSDKPAILFSGDFLFVGDVGRPDLLGKEAQEKLAHELYISLFERMAPYSDDLEIYPAHGAGSMCGKALGTHPQSTLGYERKMNPAFQKRDEKEWIDRLMDQMPEAPPYFPRMKKVNVQGPKIIGNNPPGSLPLPAREVYELQSEGAVVLDVRSKELFAKGHIPGSINIPCSSMLSSYAGWVLDPSWNLILVGEGRIEKAEAALLRVGFDAIEGHLEGGIAAWEEDALPLETLTSISVESLQEKIESGEPVVDVRTQSEWELGHIPGAYHFPMGPLSKELMQTVDKSAPLSLICGGGTRSAIMASILKRAGFTNVVDVDKGMSAWKKASLPLETGN